MDLLRRHPSVQRSRQQCMDHLQHRRYPRLPRVDIQRPARPTTGFFAAISYDGREIARADGDEADPMSIHFYPTPREIVTLDDFKWIVRMIRQGFLLSLDPEFNHWLANCDRCSYHWDFEPGVA